MKRITTGIIAIAAAVSLSSFTLRTFKDDFLKQLGISKSTADGKITQSMLDGSVDTYGLRNLKNILPATHSAITAELLNYTRQYVQSAAFKKEYAALRDSKKPVAQLPQTPEDMKAQDLLFIKKSIADATASLQKADATMKPVFEKVIAEGNKRLKAAEDPNNRQYAGYAKGYPQLLKDAEARHQKAVAKWEATYPQDLLQFIKKRLEDFLSITADVDYNAALVTKGGMKYFADKQYEQKDYRWKMAFRAGKSVTEPARAFAEKWITEIK